MSSRWYAGAGPLALVALLALAGCGAGGASTSSGSSSSGGAGAEGSPAGGLADRAGTADGTVSAPPEESAATASLARAVPTERSLIRTAQLTVRVADVGRAAARVAALTRGADGLVAAEQTSRSGSAATGQSSSYTLRVPPGALDGLLDQLAGLGTLLDRQVNTEDVTAQVVDLDSRLASQRASVERVRALLARAQTVGEVVTVEGQLAQREGDLEAMQARARALDGQVTLATVELLLFGPDASTTGGGRGFLVGLRSGWSAFTNGAAVLVTAAGAVLPFALTLLVVGAGAVTGWRALARRRRKAAAVV